MFSVSLSSLKSWWSTFLESRKASIMLTSYLSETRVDKATDWLHCIPDGESEPAFTSASGNDIQMCRFNPVTYTGGVLTWTTITLKEKAADHWSIWAHGYYWIAYCNLTADNLYLLKVEKTSTGGFNWVADYDIILGGSGTNDMFLVETPLGVAVGSMKAGGVEIRKIDTAGATTETFTLTGSSSFGNGSSMIKTRNDNWGGSGRKYLLLAPQTLSPDIESNLYYFIVDNTMKTVASTAYTFSGTDLNFAMGTQVIFANGWRIITYRKRDLADSSLPTGGDDSGNISRQMFTGSAGTTSGSEETLTTGWTGNRPHTTRFGNYLITSYAKSDGGFAAYIQVDQIS